MSTRTTALLFTIEGQGDAFVAHIYSPPNASRRDWEFGTESYVEALATVLNSLAEDEWSLQAVVQNADPPIYIMSSASP